MEQAKSIGRILNTKFPPNTPKQQSKPNYCKCGVAIELVVFGGTTHWPKLCARCDKAKTIRRTHREKAVRIRKRLELRIPRRFWNAHLRDLSPQMQAKIKALPTDKGLLLFGQPGTGKSHTMCALMRDYILKGAGVIRKTYDSLCLDIRDSYDNRELTEKEIVWKYQKIDILILEDIGTSVGVGSQESDFSLRILLLILDYRIEQCLPTHFTSNKSVDELSKSFDERVASRIHQACDIVPVKGIDRRKKSNATKNSKKT